MNDPRIAEARRIVVKIGSALLFDEVPGRIRSDWLAALADDIAALREGGAEAIVVSSGAIAARSTAAFPTRTPSPE